MFRLFDVSLRYGLQSFNEKKKILHKILLNNPTAIEIGSVVSPNILPPNEKGINIALKKYYF